MAQVWQDSRWQQFRKDGVGNFEHDRTTTWGKHMALCGRHFGDEINAKETSGQMRHCPDAKRGHCGGIAVAVGFEIVVEIVGRRARSTGFCGRAVACIIIAISHAVFLSITTAFAILEVVVDMLLSRYSAERYDDRALGFR